MKPLAIRICYGYSFQSIVKKIVYRVGVDIWLSLLPSRISEVGFPPSQDRLLITQIIHLIFKSVCACVLYMCVVDSGEGY